MIRITARLYGQLKKYVPNDPRAMWNGEVEDGTTAAELYEILGFTDNLVVLVIRNGRLASKADVLEDGDYLQILSCLGGG